MLERLWDILVDNSIALFMPLVCSYYALTGDLFLNVCIDNATGFEKAGNLLLIPFRYLCAGKEAIQDSSGAWTLAYSFEYNHYLWVKVTGSILALPPSLLLGSTVKALGFLSESTRNRYHSLRDYLSGTEIRSNQALYQSVGLDIGNPREALFFESQHYARRAGDENYLSYEKEALREVARLLNQAEIPWWIDCGTCLGAYRYGGVIPWDADLDIAVLQPDFENVRKTLSQLDQKKYSVQDWSSRDRPNSYIKIYIRESRTLIDVYHFAIEPETRELRYILSLETNLFFPEWWKIRERRFTVPVAFETVFPLKKTLLDGIEVFIPNDPKKFLQRCYGEDLAPAKIYNPLTGSYEKDLTHPYWQRIYAH
jgi:hypothetical protein